MKSLKARPNTTAGTVPTTISDFVDEYNAANPDAPMVFDYVAAKTSIPWLEIIFYVAMIGSIGM
ncbi:ATP-dependent metalloprotease FtsH, partial [human gut metagenome]